MVPCLPNLVPANRLRYIDNDTVQSQPLMRVLDQGQEAPLMVAVQFPKEGKSEGQATILAFLQEGWLRL